MRHPPPIASIYVGTPHMHVERWLESHLGRPPPGLPPDSPRPPPGGGRPVTPVFLRAHPAVPLLSRHPLGGPVTATPAPRVGRAGPLCHAGLF